MYQVCVRTGTFSADSATERLRERFTLGTLLASRQRRATGPTVQKTRENAVCAVGIFLESSLAQCISLDAFC